MSAVRRRLSVLFTPAEIDPVVSADRVVVVVDVLRSTSVVPVALAGGASEIHPASSVAEARALRERMPDALLGGEAAGEKRRQDSTSATHPSSTRPSVLQGVPSYTRARTACRHFSALGHLLRSTESRDDGSLRQRERGVRSAQRYDRRHPPRCGGEGPGAPRSKTWRFAGRLLVLVVGRLLARDDGFALDDGALMALAIWNGWKDDVPGLLAASSHGSWLSSSCRSS